MSVFGERLRELRNKKNMTQKDVALILGISSQAYQSYELGKREANHANIIKLANYFNVSTDYLLGLTDNHLKHY